MPGRKLIIQIPCFNEEASLPIVFACLPKTVAGYDCVETLVLDDGSTDRTAEVARNLGATYVLQLPHRGLAQTFLTGVRHALALGAHTVVNFDADNQYSADDIATITAPIVAGTAGVVIGERPLRSMQRFSPLKQHLHLAGNVFLRRLTGTAVTDAASGFRALRHDMACRVDIQSTYTYTIEMLLEFSLNGVPITFVPIRVTGQELRPSRLIKSNAEYLFKNSCTIVRALARRRRSATSEICVGLRVAIANVDRRRCSLEVIDECVDASQRDDYGERNDPDGVRSRLRLRPEHVAADHA